MTRVRLGLAAALVALACGTVAAAPAAAQQGGAPNANTVPALHRIQVHGVAQGGKKFNGTYAIQRFAVRNNTVYAVGTLTGTLKNRHVSRSNVALPAKLVAPNSSSAKTATKSTRQAAGSCTVLHLVLGPINLNLLGLHVTLGGGTAANQPIVLDLTAQRGGGLLGDLLCGLDNALGGSGILSQLSTQLQQLAQTLTSLVALLP